MACDKGRVVDESGLQRHRHVVDFALLDSEERVHTLYRGSLELIHNYDHELRSVPSTHGPGLKR